MHPFQDFSSEVRCNFKFDTSVFISEKKGLLKVGDLTYKPSFISQASVFLGIVNEAPIYIAFTDLSQE